MNDNPDATQNPVANTPASSSQPAGTPPSNTVQISPAAPGFRPMEQALPPEEQPKQPKKKGWVIAVAAIATLLIIGGIVAAIMIPILTKKDAVATAMAKIMGGDAPANVAIDGDIDIAVNSKYSPITNLKISLNSGLMPSSMINNSVAKVTASVRSVGDFTVEFDEIYASDGDLYFKIDGATSALEDSKILYLLNLTGNISEPIDCGEDEQCQSEELKITECKDGEECETLDVKESESLVLDQGGQNMLDEDTLSYIASMVDAIELIDGEWLRISTDDLGKIASNGLEDSDMSCVVDLVSSINSNSNSAMDLYAKYPFIKSTTEGVEIASKQYPVYKVSIDSADFANFVNSIRNSVLSQKVYSCLNLEDNVWMDKSDVESALSGIPPVYVEIDKDNNFTRLYLQSDINDGEATVTMDLNFSYPANINVPEPLEYTDFSDFIQEFSTSIYDIDIDNES